MTNQGDHYLGIDIHAGFLNSDSRLENCLHLHLIDLREDQAQPATTQSHHRIGFFQLAHFSEQAFLLAQSSTAFALGLHNRHLFNKVFFLRQKLMQRRIKQTNRDRQSIHSFKDTFEIFSLHRQKLV